MAASFFITSIIFFASSATDSLVNLATTAICHKILRMIGIPAFFLQV